MGRYRKLARWLLPTALATDVGSILVGTLIEELRLGQMIIPALSTLERLSWETRRRAQRQSVPGSPTTSRWSNKRSWKISWMWSRISGRPA